MTKIDVVTHLGKSGKSTGTSEAQIVILTAKINTLLDHHFVEHGKDKHSHYGLAKVISKRKRILAYLKSLDTKRYAKVTEELNIRSNANDSEGEKINPVSWVKRTSVKEETI